jgi:hypothetical protein
MRPISHVRFYILVFAALLFVTASAATPALAQHEMHDMSKMPGKAKPRAKPNPRPKQPAKKRTRAAQARPKQGVPAETTEAETAGEPAAAETPAPATVETPAPQSSPAPANNVHRHDAAPAEPTVAPSTTSERPAAPTTPPGSPAANQSQPAAAQPHRHDTGDVNAGGAGATAQPAGGGAMEGMKGMVHPTSGTHLTSDGHPHELLLMSDGMMDIRVGYARNNFIAMGQMGSGTSWQPTTTPMYMWSKVLDKWLLFIHADAKLGVNSQGGPRGVTKFESQNWVMPMAFRRVGRGTLQLRGMFSLEPFSFSPGGSPQLFQTGETYNGSPLVDKQHPHDLFMELSATYTLPLGERAKWFTYVGFPGEPSLGPTAFMHRVSAAENPSAPLSHHLQDSSHISFGVFSTGFSYRWLKFEASVFNGREPDEERYDFEFNPWNSRAVRVSLAPTKNLVMQWSYGLLKNPEALKPGDVRRMTASLGYNKRIRRGNWATTLIWGRNNEGHEGGAETLDGYLAESTLNFLDKNYVYTRLEAVDKADLVGHEEAAGLGIPDHHATFRIGAYTFGAARDVWNTDKFSLAVGGDLTVYSKPAALDPVYGDNPVSYKFFIRIRPNKMH